MSITLCALPFGCVTILCTIINILCIRNRKWNWVGILFKLIHNASIGVVLTSVYCTVYVDKKEFETLTLIGIVLYIVGLGGQLIGQCNKESSTNPSGACLEIFGVNTNSYYDFDGFKNKLADHRSSLPILQVQESYSSKSRKGKTKSHYINHVIPYESWEDVSRPATIPDKGNLIICITSTKFTYSASIQSQFNSYLKSVSSHHFTVKNTITDLQPIILAHRHDSFFGSMFSSAVFHLAYIILCLISLNAPVETLWYLKTVRMDDLIEKKCSNNNDLRCNKYERDHAASERAFIHNPAVIDL